MSTRIGIAPVWRKLMRTFRTPTITRLALKGEDNLTPEEEALLELLTLLIERYDDEYYRIPDAPPTQSFKC